jgi:flagellar biosynthesis protein FlhA
LAIGLTQHDLPLDIAAENYVILSVGDGLVAQIPSLLLSIATAIIVTRVSSSQDMAQHIASEVSLSRAWFPVAGVLALIGMVPGMPNLLFLLVAFIALGIGIACLISEREELTEAAGGAVAGGDPALGQMIDDDEKDPNSLDVTDVADLAAISVLLSYPLLNLVDDDSGGPLVRRITAIRKEVSQGLGFVVPSVRVRDDLALGPNLYRIKIGQTVVAEDIIYPDRKLAIPSDSSNVKIDGLDVKEPSFGIDATWIYQDRQAEAEAQGYVVIEPEAVLATHLSQVLYKHAGELIGQDEVQELLDNLAKTAPSLVQSVVPKLMPLHNITAIVRNLLKERIPISDMRRILEVLSEMAGRNLGVAELSEALRPYLVELLIQQSVPLSQPIPVITIDSDFEHLLINTARQSDSEQLMLDGALAQRLVKSLTTTNEEQIAKGQKPHLVVAPVIRRKLSMFLRQYLPELVVLSFAELPEARKVEVVATISGNDGLLPQ